MGIQMSYSPHSVGSLNFFRVPSNRSSWSRCERLHDPTSPKTPATAPRPGILSKAVPKGAGARRVALPTLRAHRRTSGASYEAAQSDGRRCPAESDRGLHQMPSRLASAEAVTRSLALVAISVMLAKLRVAFSFSENYHNMMTGLMSTARRTLPQDIKWR